VDYQKFALSNEELLWQDWDDCYIVFQLSSGETHVFNETTAIVLRYLEKAPATMAELLYHTGESLGVGPGGISPDDMAFVVTRLDELGLIEYL
jgi:PqqD family protein of HPr-rel-A system